MKKRIFSPLLIAGLLFAGLGSMNFVLAAESETGTISETTLSDIDKQPEVHTHQTDVWKVVQSATATADGLENAACSVCGQTMKRVISRPAKITLSNTRFLYNDNYKKPAVTLYDAKGKVISKTQYSKSYSSNKMPGTGHVKVRLNTERYQATLETDFKIALETVSFSSTSAKTEGFTLKWKPLNKFITGYIVSWSTSPTFSNSSSRKLSSRSEHIFSKEQLKGNTVYYIRIRTYMDRKGKTYKSSWSVKRKIRTLQNHCVKLLAVGDDLLHTPVYQSMQTKSSYNFDPMFAHIKDDIEMADLAVINQETILVKSNYSNYPRFGSPMKVANAIEKVGFNVVTHATNHTMDRGINAIFDTINYWKKFPDVTVLGVHKSQKDAENVKIIEKNGIKIAMLNYTKGTNGIKIPAGKSYLIDILDNKHEMRKMIKQAKRQSDFVIVFAHWGKEYVYTPDPQAVEWAQFFADSGVDLVIGTHPHVLEPIRKVKGKRGNEMICYYSLGNFISAQSQVPTLLGGMADVTIVKDASGTRIKNYKMIPLVTHQTDCLSPFTTYKLEDYTDKLARENTIHKRSSETFTVKRLKSLYKSIMKK